MRSSIIKPFALAATLLTTAGAAQNSARYVAFYSDHLKGDALSLYDTDPLKACTKDGYAAELVVWTSIDHTTIPMSQTRFNKARKSLDRTIKQAVQDAVATVNHEDFSELPSEKLQSIMRQNIDAAIAESTKETGDQGLNAYGGQYNVNLKKGCIPTPK